MTQAQNVAVESSQINSSGVLQPAGGGTGLSSVGTTGNVLTSDGTNWTSSANPPAFASGTVMLFAQTAAPTGWTKDITNYNNYALRVVTGTASTGGSVAFTTAFASQSVTGTTDATTLALSQIAAHDHTYPAGQGSSAGSQPYAGASNTSAGAKQLNSSQGGGGSHTHAFTGNAINLAVQYVDIIRATKN